MFPLTVDAAHESVFLDTMFSDFDPSAFLADYGTFTSFGENLFEFADGGVPLNNPIQVDESFNVEKFFVSDSPSYALPMALPIDLPAIPQDVVSKEEFSPVCQSLSRVDIKESPKNKRKPMEDIAPMSPKKTHRGKSMEQFPAHRVVHWKYVLYNLLVENYNSEDKNTLVMPCEVNVKGKMMKGFSLNQALDPKKRLAELYSLYVRKEDLASEDYSSPFIQDLYKYYLRCALQLMNKFFIKAGPWTYLYDEIILFIADEDLATAEMRLRFLEGKKKRRGSLD